jgi:hypothetical protein
MIICSTATHEIGDGFTAAAGNAVPNAKPFNINVDDLFNHNSQKDFAALNLCSVKNQKSLRLQIQSMGIDEGFDMVPLCLRELPTDTTGTGSSP